MSFDEYKNIYFSGDSELALRALVNEAINDEYKLTGGKMKHKEVLDSLDTNLANTYVEYFDEAIEIMNTEENVSQDIKDKVLSLKVIDHKLKHSAYSTKGMKYGMPISLVVIILLWILLGHKGTFEFLITGVFMVPFIIIILCYAGLSTKVTKSIKNRNFYIVEDEIIDKIHKPGNAEDAPEYFLVFQNYAKYRLVFDEERFFNIAKKGHLCYLLIPTNSKKSVLYLIHKFGKFVRKIFRLIMEYILHTKNPKRKVS